MKKSLILFFMAAAFASCGGGFGLTDIRDIPTENFGERNFCWRITSDRDSTVQTAYRIDVALSKKDLKSSRDLVWTSGRVESDNLLYIPYEGPELQGDTRYYWRVTAWDNYGREAAGSIGSWISGLRLEDWTAKWIGVDVDDLTTRGNTEHLVLPVRYLRKEFRIDKAFKSATLYICGLGNSECYINGSKVSDDIFGPLPTLYTKAVDYITYDVTWMLKKGSNAIGAALGMGRYSGPEVPHGLRDNTFFGLPCMIAELHIEYRDGSRDVIVSDTSWKATNKGPITNSNEYDGEYYDARLELGDWTEPDYEEAESIWKEADLMPAPEGGLRAQNAPCVKVCDRLVPQKIWRTEDGRIMVDLGQNIAGRLNVTLQGKAGSPIRFRYAEVLMHDDPDMLDVSNLRKSLVLDEYIRAKDGKFSWTQIFTYHGFRFIEITGLDYIPDACDLIGEVLHDEAAVTGHFECSDDMINRIAANNAWGESGNWRGMPTDCPQRNEKVGWTGDHVVQAYAGAYEFDNEYLYAKWMLDIMESQFENGIFSNVSPKFWRRDVGDPNGSMTIFNGIDMLYRFYGNEGMVRSGYPSLKCWLDYVESELLEDGIVAFDSYGDWCAAPEDPHLIHSKETWREAHPCIISTTAVYYEMMMMERFASLCGYPEDARHYRETAAMIKASFNRHYYNEDGAYYGGSDFLEKSSRYESSHNLISRTYPAESVGNVFVNNLIAVAYGLTDGSNEAQVLESMRKICAEQWNDHPCMGEIGVREVMRTLSRKGYSDLAFKLATNEEYPSWGYMVRNGATTIWELWNGNTADPAMNSHNHLILSGDYVIWLYEDLAGIRPAAPGFRKIEFSPIIPEGLDYVNASYDSAYGLIVSNWKIEDGRFLWHVEIPAGATAAIHFPDGNMLEAGSGSYDFDVAM